MTGRVLLYGATGYTGREVAAALAGRVDLVLAGRDPERVRAIAEPLGVAWQAFDCGPVAAMASRLAGTTLVLNAAGPFDLTAPMLADGCIAVGAHYLDLGGEWPVFLEIMRRDEAARAAGVMLLPGVGLTIAATDCLLKRAVERWPDTARLCLGISRAQVISRGSVASAARLLSPATMIRRNGELVAVPAGSLTRAFDFGGGLSEAAAMSWADVVTGGFTTGVPDIEVYSELRWNERASMRASGLAMGWSGPGPARALAGVAARFWPAEPPPATRAAARFTMVVEAHDPWRRVRRLCLRTLDGYGASVLSAAEAVRRVLAGTAQPGFQTPARVFGSGFMVEAGAAAFATDDAREAA